MKYRAIGLDLDGTLLDRSGKIGPRTLQAVTAAVDAGVLIVPCTGRAWRESRGALADIIAILHRATGDAGAPLASPGVFVGGAMVCDLRTGRALDLAVIEPNLARRLIDHLFDSPESVLVFRDANVVGHDYLITGRGALSPNTQWWFEATGATVCFQKSPTEQDVHHVLRVGMVGPPHRVDAVARDVEKAFGSCVRLQHFQAVQMPDPRECVSVLEIFAPSVDKWRGLAWITSDRGIEPADVAAIGDEVNDLALLSSVGCGIAMGNAIDSVKAAARHVTASCEEEGVAVAIEHLLAGRWQ